MEKGADPIPVIKEQKVVYKGVFDMTDLYKTMFYWLRNKGYGGIDNNFKETIFAQRIKGDTKKLEIGWIAEKELV